VGAQLRVVQAQVPGPQAEQATLVRLVGRPDDARRLTDGDRAGRDPLAGRHQRALAEEATRPDRRSRQQDGRVADLAEVANLRADDRAPVAEHRLASDADRVRGRR
jgi:hypothetical protein